MSEYTDNILGQPEALRTLLARLELDPIQAIAARVQAGQFDRIILTGMGASWCAAYPAWAILAAAGLPAWWLEAGELLESGRRLVTPKTLLWIVSQGGHGLEALGLLAPSTNPRPKLVWATTNNLDSPLAAKADVVMPLHTAVEHGVATRTFINTLAATQLAALAMTAQDLAPGMDALHRVAEALDGYLGEWERRVDEFSALLPAPDRLLLVGGGSSLAAALDGALVLKEAARSNAEGLSTGQFRHGPLELADDRLAVLIFEGAAPLAAADRQLAQTMAACGARALWVGNAAAAPVAAVPTPRGEGLARPIAQIVPIQLLSLYLARRGGFEAAAFRHLGKVTWPELPAVEG